MSKAVKTRLQWAAEIHAAHRQSIEGILKIGHTLIAAKKALPHGAFEKMVEDDLPFTPSTAQRLMKIARDPRIRKAARVQLLPAVLGALYELTQLPDAEFDKAVSSGAINPKMTREQAKSVRVQVTHSTVRTASPYYRTVDREDPIVASPIYKTTDNDEDTRPMRLVAPATQRSPRDVPDAVGSSTVLSQIERLVGDLSMAVEHGDVGADSTFAGRVRAVADRLLSMIADGERRAIH